MITIKHPLTATLLASALLVAPTLLFAEHSWSNYHWPRSQNLLILSIGDNISLEWDVYLTEAVSNPGNDWNDSSTLELSTVPGGTLSNTKKCSPTKGRVEVCNALYGNRGWLGIAQIWLSGDHITQGIAKLNDTYFNTTTYNKPEWKRLVMCQEIGHTFGLDHQDENHENGNLGTCMDYTSSPLGPPKNEFPNAHDYGQLDIIYRHTDSGGALTSSNASAAAAAQPGGESPAEWGALMRSSNGGHTEVYERELGGGQKIVTFVIWTEEQVRTPRR